MSNWIIKSVDQMKISQDVATNPPSASTIDTVSAKAKDIGANYLAISVPYDLPNGGGDVIAQTQAWVDAAKKYGVNMWHRHSWCSDQGWYGVSQNFTNDRIQDTVNWIKAHPGFFKDGDIFTPKPEPQNCGIQGVNTGGQGRWASAAAFNQWVRDITAACKNAFTSLGIHVKVGYFGFDGYIVCGYGNSDWQGKSFLEAATVAATDNIITGDHYPPAGTTMADFLSVFKKTWPNIQYVEGEYGPIQSGDVVTQIKTDIGALAADPIVIGLNYWTESDNGAEALLDGNYNPTPSFSAVQTFFQGSVTPTPTPTPTPGQSVVSFTLINADTNQDIRDLVNGETIDRTTLPTKNLNVRVNTNPKTVGSVKITGENPHTENSLPYSVYGDNNGVYVQYRFPDGVHTITATPFTQSNLGGTPGTPLTITFNTLTSTASTPTPPMQTIFSITGTVTITKDSTGKVSLKIDATG